MGHILKNFLIILTPEKRGHKSNTLTLKFALVYYNPPIYNLTLRCLIDMI